MHHRCRCVLLSIGGVGLLAVGASAAPFFQPLGEPLGGPSASFASGLSADGEAVIGTADTMATGAYRWTASSGAQALVAPGGDVEWATPHAASSNGNAIVGTALLPGGTQGSVAFRWTLGAGFAMLPRPVGAWTCEARAVSADGAIAVGESVGPSGSNAVLWDIQGQLRDLGDLPGYEGSGDRAIDVSADGTVVVGDAGGRPFRWTAASGMQPLGDFDGYVAAMSGDGRTVVGRTAEGRAFCWSEDAGLTLLSMAGFPAGAGAYDAWDVSYDGSIIVGSGAWDGGGGTLVWDATGHARLLRDILESDLGLDLAGHTLVDAVAMSADGLTFVGNEMNAFTSKPEGWVARIPEPGTLVMLLGAAGIAAMRRRRL